MSRRHVASALGIIMAVWAFAPLRVAGQSQASSSKPPAAAKTWTQPRTPDGDPDLQGVWLGYDRTPFEAGPRRQLDPDDERAVVVPYGAVWTQLTRPAEKARRSLVVDPPDGIVPIKESALRQRDYDLAHVNDSWVHQTPWERCITRGVPGGMISPSYNAAFQFVQGPGYFAILYEMIHETRIIPVDGSPHLPSTIRQWSGDSRGHWEGNTLVVDVTNYNGLAHITTSGSSARVRGIHQSEAAHVVERFTRVSADQINYEVTIDDPQIYTRPWTVAMLLTRDDTYQIYEYACHEGNQGLPNTLSAGRARDRAAKDVNAAGK
jgi:hypothetical protein